MDFPTSSGFKSTKTPKKVHHFLDTPDETCCCLQNIAETSCHYLLHCPNFTNHRNQLFQTLTPILQINGIHFIDDNNLVHLLLYGNERFKIEENQRILQATINFIRNTSRFSHL